MNVTSTMEPQPTLSDGHPETPSPPPMAPSDGLPETPLPVRDSSPPCDPLPTPSHPCDHATGAASLLAISPQDEADADLAPERLSVELSSLPHEGHGDAPPAGEEAGLCVTGASGTDAPVAAAVSSLQVKAKQEVSSFPSEQGNCEVAVQLKAKPEVSSFPSEQGNREVAVQLKANPEVSSFPSEQGNPEVAVQLEAKPEVSSFPSEQGNREVAGQLKANPEVSSFPSEQGNREVAVQLKAKSEVSSFSSEQGNREVAVQLKANPEVSSFPSDQGNREVAGQLKANPEVSSFPSEQGNCEVAVQLKANPEVSSFSSDQGNREVAGQLKANPEVSSFPSEQGNPEVAVQHHEANPEVSSFPFEHGNREVAVQLKAKPEPQVSSFPSEQGNHEVAVQLKANPKVSSFPSKQGNHEVAQILELNRVGLPIRENARNCMYYMRKGNCRYGKRCCFNHPEHVLDVQLYKPTGWDDTNLSSSPHLKKSSSPHSKKSSEHASLDDISSSSEILPPNILRMLLPPQTLPPGSEAKEMKVKKDPDWSSASDDSDSCCSADSSDGPLCKQEHHVDYPGRPGRQECPFLLKYGNCKFASSCQYYHANDKLVRQYHQKDPSLSEELMVYPDKPGAPECPFYMKTGACKFGTECKFHHPKDLPPSMQGSTIPKRPLDPKEIHPETTLQDHMDQQQNYPERPGQPECRYYMQFGKCKFLSACIFHHPRDRVRSTLECPFYMKTGTCQFGSACEFNHSGKGGEIDDRTEYGHNYPKRPGGNECFHYMEHGYCRFQMNCKYHHPTD